MSIPVLELRVAMGDAIRRLHAISETLTKVPVPTIQRNLSSVIGVLSEPLFALAFKCKALAPTDPPQDCDWPKCGCDPYANTVIEAVQEQEPALTARLVCNRCQQEFEVVLPPLNLKQAPEETHS